MVFIWFICFRRLNGGLIVLVYEFMFVLFYVRCMVLEVCVDVCVVVCLNCCLYLLLYVFLLGYDDWC